MGDEEELVSGNVGLHRDIAQVALTAVQHASSIEAQNMGARERKRSAYRDVARIQAQCVAKFVDCHGQSPGELTAVPEYGNPVV